MTLSHTELPKFNFFCPLKMTKGDPCTLAVLKLIYFAHPHPSHQPASQVNSTLPVSKSWNVLSLAGQKRLCLRKMQKLSTNNHSRVTTKLLKYLSQLT